MECACLSSGSHCQEAQQFDRHFWDKYWMQDLPSTFYTIDQLQRADTAGRPMQDIAGDRSQITRHREVSVGGGPGGDRYAEFPPLVPSAQQGVEAADRAGRSIDDRRHDLQDGVAEAAKHARGGLDNLEKRRRDIGDRAGEAAESTRDGVENINERRRSLGDKVEKSAENARRRIDELDGDRRGLDDET